VTVSTLTVVPEASASGTAPSAEPTPSSLRLRPGRRLRLLDLFCGGGGASAGYHAAGFDVVGVDIVAQPDYPFPFVLADALSVDLTGFDVIAASPPCQRYSTATPPHRRDQHPDLVGPIRHRLAAAVGAPGGPQAYVIENVPGAPLRDPIVVCGDTLRLGVRRHRLFESNLPLTGTGCVHDRPTPPVAVYGTYGQQIRRRYLVEGQTSPSTGDARTAMGIDWLPWPALTQAVPPAYTHWLGLQLMLLLPPAHTGDATAELGRFVTATAAHPSSGDESRRRLTSPDPVPSVTDTTHLVGSVTGGTTPPAVFRHCRCGRPLPPPPATGRWPRHCSHACRQAAYRQRRAGTR
jgi:hypothetical protein